MKIESSLIALFLGPIFNAGGPVLIILGDTAGRLWVGPIAASTFSRSGFHPEDDSDAMSAYMEDFLTKARCALTDRRSRTPLLFISSHDRALVTNYNEKSLVRTTLAFDLFRSMGHYAPRARLCEVFLNSVYRGVYVFTETIKEDKNRVDIATLNPDENTGDDLTGGYIIKIDYFSSSDSWQSNYRPIGHPSHRVYFVYHAPKPDEISLEQKEYIKGFIDFVKVFGNGGSYEVRRLLINR